MNSLRERLLLSDLPDIDYIAYERDPTNDYQFVGDYDRLHYAETKKHFSDKWKYYSSDSMMYKTNVQGFRVDTNLDDVDWENSIALVGCSHVFGDGVYSTETISAHLSEFLGCPVINLGFPGASNKQIHNNAIVTYERYKPKDVIILWSHDTRNTWTYGTRNRFYDNVETWEHEKILTHMKLDKFEPWKQVPPAYFDVCLNTIYDNKLYRSVHNLIGTKQHDVLSLSKRVALPPHDHGSISYFLSNPFDHSEADYQFLNEYYARDVTFDPDTGMIRQIHYGNLFNREIAKLIAQDFGDEIDG